jgi:tetratricopeptide (TPR) repeat protein
MMASDSPRRVSLFQDAIRLHPQYSEAIYQLGRQYYLDMDFVDSAPQLEKVREGSPEYRQAQFMLGVDDYNTGEFDKAAAIFTALPPVYDVLINLGMAQAGKGDISGAMATWRRAADVNPLGSESYFNLAFLGLTRGDPNDAASAVQDMDRLLLLRGRDPEAIFLEGRIYERLGRLDESQRLIASAVSLSPRLQRWVNQTLPNLGRLRPQINVTEIRLAPQGSIWNQARLSRRSNGRDLAGWLDSVQESVDSQSYGDALQELQEIDRTFPQSSESRLMFAQIYEDQKRNDLAVSEYKRALLLKPSADTWILLARLYRTMNLAAEEVQAIDAALALEPNNSAAKTRKAEIGRPAAPRRRQP